MSKPSAHSDAEIRAKVKWILDTRHTVPVDAKISDVHTDRIVALIEEQTRLARIDELNRVPRTNYGDDFTIHINAYLNERTPQLSNTKETQE